jgi:hypothetical protein
MTHLGAHTARTTRNLARLALLRYYRSGSLATSSTMSPLTVFLLPLVSGALADGYGWPERDMLSVSGTTTFETGIGQRDRCHDAATVREMIPWTASVHHL